MFSLICVFQLASTPTTNVNKHKKHGVLDCMMASLLHGMSVPFHPDACVCPVKSAQNEQPVHLVHVRLEGGTHHRHPRKTVRWKEIFSDASLFCLFFFSFFHLPICVSFFFSFLFVLSHTARLLLLTNPLFRSYFPCLPFLTIHFHISRHTCLLNRALIHSFIHSYIHSLSTNITLSQSP